MRRPHSLGSLTRADLLGYLSRSTTCQLEVRPASNVGRERRATNPPLQPQPAIPELAEPEFLLN